MEIPGRGLDILYRLLTAQTNSCMQQPKSRTPMPLPPRTPFLYILGGALCLLAFAAVPGSGLVLAADPDEAPRILAKANTQDQVEACREKARHILIQVEDVRDEGGVITADLHDDDPDKWLVGKEKLDRERWRVATGTTEICFTVEETGTYAIALYHDLNANGDFDKSFLGIPVEPFGISNNPSIVLSPPNHEKAAFEVTEAGVSLTIRLKHGFRSGSPPGQDK